MNLYEAIKKFCEYYRFNVQQNTNNSYAFILRNFCLYHRNMHLEEMTIEDIVRYFQAMDDLGWDRGAIHTKAIVLRRFFGYFKKSGYQVLNYELIPIPVRRQKMPRVASEEKYQKLLQSIPDKLPVHERNKALIMLYHDTGARNAEILSLNTNDINLIEKRAIIRTEKAKKLPFREIFWSEETNAQLKKWLRIRKKFTDNEIAFIGLSRSSAGRRLGNRGVVKFLEEYSERAGMETLNAHSLRHLFGVKYAKSGANNSAISSLMGHSDMQSSHIYTSLYGEDLKEVWGKYGN